MPDWQAHELAQAHVPKQVRNVFCLWPLAGDLEQGLDLARVVGCKGSAAAAAFLLCFSR